MHHKNQTPSLVKFKELKLKLVLNGVLRLRNPDAFSEINFGWCFYKKFLLNVYEIYEKLY